MKLSFSLPPLRHRWEEERLPKALRSGQAPTPTHTQKPHKWHHLTLVCQFHRGCTLHWGQQCLYTQHHTTSHLNQECMPHSTCPPPFPMHCTIGCMNSIKLCIHCKYTCIHIHTSSTLLTVEQLQLTVESIYNGHWCHSTTKSGVECLLWIRQVHLSKCKG